MCKYHLNFENDKTMLKCKFVTQPTKISKSVKKALQGPTCQPNV